MLVGVAGRAPGGLGGGFAGCHGREVDAAEGCGGDGLGEAADVVDAAVGVVGV